MTDLVSLLTLGLQSADRIADAYEAEISRFEDETDLIADDLEQRLMDLESTLLHNTITQALQDPKLHIVPDSNVMHLLGEDAAQIFGTANENVFQFQNSSSMKQYTSEAKKEGQYAQLLQAKSRRSTLPLEIIKTPN